MERKINQENFTQERALFGAKDVEIYDTIFERGESPLKHSENVVMSGCGFRWKYPLWYTKNISVKNCAWFENARAGVWYAKDFSAEKCVIAAPKNFRRCKGVSLKEITFSDAKETFWDCENVILENVTAKGDYFAMNCANLDARELTLCGNYAFDGVKNLVLRNSRLISKDAFWNSENVSVYDSFISGEYLGWNAKNLTLVNCTVESLQGFCYIDKLVMKNCRLLNTSLAFEYSDVDADIRGKIDSVFNPSSGVIRADFIGKLIIQRDKIQPEKTRVLCDDVEEITEEVIFP